ncbi:MAG TPA: phosphoribosyltransferase family protein [Chitinophagaceae bacterium]|nr:phosphoribosyltransferase family protein [Chitinophagaceae bacterium]
MLHLKYINDSVLQLFFPHICAGCGSDVLNKEYSMCLRCINSLPETNFELKKDNPVEKIFWGRVELESATAQFYFTKESLMQHLMHQFKYKGNRELGLQLGRLMGSQLKQSNRFTSIDALVPLPLFPEKERKRGYNQATILCEGIASAMGISVLENVVSRPQHTDTQTSKGRIDRWKNMEGKFILTDAAIIAGKHVLLVDDVITTGATLEACCIEILKTPGIKLSVATLCMASR